MSGLFGLWPAHFSRFIASRSQESMIPYFFSSLLLCVEDDFPRFELYTPTLVCFLAEHLRTILQSRLAQKIYALARISLAWVNFCFVYSRPVSSEQVTCRCQDSIQVMLFSRFTSVTTFWGCTSILRPQQRSESELEDFTPITVGSEKLSPDIL